MEELSGEESELRQLIKAQPPEAICYSHVYVSAPLSSRSKESK